MKKLEKKTIFSIITVVLNGEKHLEKTIKSVVSQKENFQYTYSFQSEEPIHLEISKDVSNNSEYDNFWANINIVSPHADWLLGLISITRLK